MMRRLAVVVAIAGSLLLAPRVEATSITGSLQFGGFASPTNGSAWSSSTTGINFLSGLFGVGSGSYAGVPPTPTTFTNFTFSTVSPSTPVPLWSFLYGGNTYSFSLSSILGTAYNPLTSTFGLSGLGTLAISGGLYTPTAGTFNFSSQNPGTTGLFSFSASGAAVPEPGSMILLGTGLIGLGAAARRRWTRKQ